MKKGLYYILNNNTLQHRLLIHPKTAHQQLSQIIRVVLAAVGEADQGVPPVIVRQQAHVRRPGEDDLKIDKWTSVSVAIFGIDFFVLEMSKIFLFIASQADKIDYFAENITKLYRIQLFHLELLLFNGYIAILNIKFYQKKNI